MAADQTFLTLGFLLQNRFAYKNREAEITPDDATPVECTKTTDQVESQVRGLSGCCCPWIVPI